MNVLLGDILLIFIPDREIRGGGGVGLRSPQKIFWSLKGFGPQFGLKIRRVPGPTLESDTVLFK